MRHGAYRAAWAAAALALFALGVPASRAAAGDEEADRMWELRRSAERIRPLHREKRPPRPGEWLASHRERGQTFAQYRTSRPNRPDGIHTTLYVQPLGRFAGKQGELIEQTGQFLARFYGLPTRVLRPLRLAKVPRWARRVHPEWGDRQILTTYILRDVLLPRRPRDAVAFLGLTTTDLWPGRGWNFVFGQASLRQRVGVWSLYRYGDPEGSRDELLRFRRRLFKVAMHETGHMLGMQHCTAYECGMNGSNHLAEMDRRPLWFCPECVQKVWWACRADPYERYRRLADFAQACGLTEEAAFWGRSARALTPP